MQLIAFIDYAFKILFVVDEMILKINIDQYKRKSLKPYFFTNPTFKNLL